MTGSIQRYIYFSTVITFCSLYAAQPIQPHFQAEFQLTGFQAILFTTLMMAPLGVAPLLYGYILEAFSAKRMVRVALFGMGVLELFFAAADNYLTLLVIRAIQGLLVPAILTSLMSYISYTAPKESVQHSIAAYIAATIFGGFLGRLLSGICTDLFGWRFFFVILGVLLIINAMLLRGMVQDVKLTYARPRMNEILALLRRPDLFWLYASIFCLFFVFAALMNFLPFEMKRLHPQSGETVIGLQYLGYSMGIVVSLNSRAILRRVGSEPNAIAAGILIFALGAVFFYIENFLVMFAAMFVFCAGLFTAHSQLSGLANKLTLDNKAIANGLYISFYYTGGTFGSVLPGAVFQHFGWNSFVTFLLLMIGVAFVFNSRLKRAVHSQ